MKEDLIAVREAGGLLGNVVCVRKSELPDEVVQYARQNQIALIYKRDLESGFRDLLFPNRPAGQADLAGLLRAFGSAPVSPS